MLKRSAEDGGPDARARVERQEHKRWAKAAVKILFDMGAPVTKGADRTIRDEALLLNLFSRSRASTLRARVRVHRKFLD